MKIEIARTFRLDFIFFKPLGLLRHRVVLTQLYRQTMICLREQISPV